MASAPNAHDLLSRLTAAADVAVLSERTGQSVQTLQAWMTGASRPTAGQAFALLKAAGHKPYRHLERAFDLTPGASDPIDAAVEAMLRGRTLRQLADESGVSRHAIRRIRMAPERMRFESFVALLRATHNDPNAWFDIAQSAVTPLTHRVAIEHGLQGLSARHTLAVGQTLGVDADALPEIHGLLTRTLEDALSALPLEADGRRQAVLSVHAVRIDDANTDRIPPTPAHIPLPDAVDCEALSREVVRAARGDRSQMAMSMRMGFQSNVVYRWEAGRAVPFAVDVLRFLQRTGVDVAEALCTRVVRSPTRLDVPQAVPWLMNTVLTSGVSERVIRTLPIDSHRLGRLRRGDALPRLPEFLGILQAATGRLLDLLDALVPIDELPSLAWVIARHNARSDPRLSRPDLGRLLLSLRHAAWLRSTGDLQQLSSLSGIAVDELTDLLVHLQNAGLAKPTPNGWRADFHTSVSHERNRAAYERMVRQLFDWATHRPGFSKALHVRFQQTDVTTAMHALTKANIAVRRHIPAPELAPTASIALVMQLTPTDGEPLWFQRGGPASS